MDRLAGDSGPVAVEPMPGYLDLITKASTVILGAWRDCATCGLELSKRTLLDNAYITMTEIALFFFCAYLWTQIRWRLTESLFKVRDTTTTHHATDPHWSDYLITEFRS